MPDDKKDWGRKLACGCALGYERCIDCRPGLHPDQEIAIEMTLARLKQEQAPPVSNGMRETGGNNG
jgi:hypothetical protein